ncbi:MAG: hypothetical protein SVV67_05440 [Bacillota bacterium]|nr:hypothetical protein [Bacillota bacterium]
MVPIIHYEGFFFMQAEKLKNIIEGLRIWQRRDERAPHKPLLILFALGRLVRGDPRLMSYAEVKDDLRKLLVEFGPYRQNYLPAYPFVRLTNDKIWEITGIKDIDTKRDWSDRELTDTHTMGGFTEEVYNLLQANQDLVREIAENILRANFPDSIHQDILDQVGLELAPKGILSRSPDFRNKKYSALTSTDVLSAVSMSALAIPWWQWKQPISNGIRPAVRMKS